MKKITLLYSLLLSLTCYSQSWQWTSSENYDSYVTDPNIIVNDKYGNSYIGSRSYYTGVHIIKYDPLGAKLWEKNYTGGSTSIQSIATDSSANVYFTLCAKTIEGITYPAPSGINVFMKCDPNGNLLWIKSRFCRYLLSERTDAENNLICTGSYIDTVDIGNGHILYTSELEDEQYIAKFDVNGNCIWSIQNDGGRYSLSVNSTGDMFAWAELYTGVTTVGQDSNMVTLNPADGDTYFAKYDSTGALKWVTQGCGFFTGDNFGNGYILECTGGNHFYLKKYDPSGNLLWQRTHFTTDLWEKLDMTCDSQGNILFTGGFSNSLTIDDTTITVSGLKSFVAKIDSSGTLKWLTISSGGSAGAKDISIGDDGAIYITGDMSGTVCFGPHCTTQPSGVFAAKLLDVDVTGVKETPPEDASLTIYPNPGSGIFTVTYENPLAEKLRLEIHNSTGQLVWSCNENSCGTSFKRVIDLSKQPKGIYFLQVVADGKSSSKKIILN